jgi:PAS domain S-box-containing protein
MLMVKSIQLVWQRGSRKGLDMLQKLSEQIKFCFERALDAKRKADEATDQAVKADFLEMEKRWLTLARSYEFSERLSDFTAANSAWRRRIDTWLRKRDEAPRLQKIMHDDNVDAFSERMWLASIVESSDDAIISQNLDGIITSWNNGARLLFGYLAEEAIGKPAAILIPADRHDEEDIILEHIRHGNQVDHHETIRQRKDKTRVVISLTVSPVRDATGKIVGASKIARDITERKRSEAQIAVLAREAEHRSRNLLANIGAMVRLSRSDSAQGLRNVIEGRIGALANVHSLFALSGWLGAELDGLINQVLSPYLQAGEVRAEIDGPAVMLKPDVAQVMAVVLHELMTNAVKYGALSATEGQVRVEWSPAVNGTFVLRWSEQGGPPVHPPLRKGFGIRVMEAMIRGHIIGDVRLDWRVEGLVCEVTLPV